MNKIIYNDNFPYLEKLKKLNFEFIHEDEIDKLENEQDCIIDFTQNNYQKKSLLLEKLSAKTNSIISDLSINYAADYFYKFNKLKAATAFNFYSVNNTHEFFSLDDKSTSIIENLSKDLEIKLEKINHIDSAFIYPRVVSMIINEAYFAKDEQLSKDEDIDTAMKFGVNYPLGPFEWAKKIGTEKIISLLEELNYFFPTGRYQISSSLRRFCYMENTK